MSIIGAHTIHGARGARRTSKRLGRGNGSQKGAKSGRGGKGQTARSGGGRRSAIRALRPALLKIPKLRGFRSMYAKMATVTLGSIDHVAVREKHITPGVLMKAGLVPAIAEGVKIVATGDIKKAVTIEGCVASKKAVAAIEAAGGKIVS